MTGMWQPSFRFTYVHSQPLGVPTLTRSNLWPNLRAVVTVTHYALRPYRINQELKRRGSRENAAEGQFNDDLRQQESLLGVTLSISTLSIRSSSLGPVSTPASIPSTTWSPHSTQSPSKATIVHQQAQGTSPRCLLGGMPASRPHLLTELSGRHPSCKGKQALPPRGPARS